MRSLTGRLTVLAFVLCVAATGRAQSLPLEQGDHICLIGNTLAERMQHDGWLETALQLKFPQHELVIRNLGYSADEVAIRPRPNGFATPDQHLTFNQADVIFAFFGYNESTRGEAGREQFRRDLIEFIDHTRQQRYNGTSAPRLVLFSPVFHENLGDPNLPDGVESNRRLRLYVAEMQRVAAEKQVPFVDLYAPTQAVAANRRPLTNNGIHLNSDGNKLVAEVTMQSLFGGPAANVPPARAEQVRAVVLDKNFHWFNHYRTLDGNDIYGGRADLAFVNEQTNRNVADRELQVLNLLVSNRDKAIWAAARGQDYVIDDSNTPPFIPVVSNIPGSLEGGKHSFLGGEEAISRMTVHSNMQVNLFASEEQFPELINPVQMTFDTKGRLWVAAWSSYPRWIPKDKLDDRLLIFEDTNGDGRADVCKTFVGGLHCPTGFEFWNGGVLIGQAPDIMFLKDTDGDDVADVKVRVLHGFDSADTHHMANSFTLGPEGAVYFQEGTFQRTSVETPWGGPVRNFNGCAWRFDGRTWDVQRYIPADFANPHGHVFDYWGTDFITDGTGNVNYFAAPMSGMIDSPTKHPRPNAFFQQRSRPCAATEILSSSHFPEELRDTYLICDVIQFRGILQYKILEDGAGFTAEELEPILSSDDPNFRPVDAETGPDGALYFLDWQNPIIGHMQHNIRDPNRDKVHGRVYRVTYKDRPLLTPRPIAGQPIPALLDVLKQRDNRERYRARIELSGRDSDDVIAALDQWIGQLDSSDPNFEHHLLEGLWIRQHHNRMDEAHLRRVLESPSHHARAAATHLLSYARIPNDLALSLLRQRANESHPRVRLEAVRAASFFRTGEAADVALDSLKYESDYWLNFTFTETMKQLEQFWKASLQQGQQLAVNNPAGIEYLLASVTGLELTKLPRSRPVYLELLARADVPHDFRHEAVMELAKLNGTNMTAETLAAIRRIDAGNAPNAERILSDLAHLLTMDHAGAQDFAGSRAAIEELASQARRSITRRVAYVTLMRADGSIDAAWRQASRSLESLTDLINSLPLVTDQSLKASLHARLLPLLKDQYNAELAARLDSAPATRGRYVRVESAGINLTEVEVLSDAVNIALRGQASLNSPGGAEGPEPPRAEAAIDGDQNAAIRIAGENTGGRGGRGGGGGGRGNRGGRGRGPTGPPGWWEVDLGALVPIDAVVLTLPSGEAVQAGGGRGGRGRGRGGNNAAPQFTLTILDAERQVVARQDSGELPAGQPEGDSITFEFQGDPRMQLRNAAVNAITYTGVDETQTFRDLAELLQNDRSRTMAARALGRIPRRSWPAEGIADLVNNIVAHIGRLPDNQKTSAAALDELALGNALAAVLPRDAAQQARELLREVGVNVIRIRPVPHDLRFDLSQIFVEAGKPVELVFENIDIMPHNIVFIRPGTLTTVGMAAERMVGADDAFARQFIPDLPDAVLFGSRLLQPEQTQRLRFIAPAQPGDYPYVCTFPGHWRRMYGTMHVVARLSDLPPEALAAPLDPGAATRPFVQAWTLDDLLPGLANMDRQRSYEQGHRLFTTLACIRCHKMNGEGAVVGPDLTAVKEKFAAGTFTRADLLREMVEPSAKIDPKFATTTIVDTQGRLHTGIVIERTGTEVKLAGNALDGGNVIVVRVADIDEELPSTVSMMPAGQLNTLTREEIYDLILYVESGGNSADPRFAPAAGGGPPPAAGEHAH